LRVFSTTVVLLLAFVLLGTAAERISLNGTITDAISGNPLPAAHLRIAGTSRGTITSPAGQYTLQVEPGTYTIIASMLGYRPETTLVVVSHATVHNARLQPSDIILPEIVITTEDPAVEIIRRAIAAKRHWIGRLASYQMEAFTRQVIRRDTAIASVTESFTRGYWQQGDTLRETVLQRRQTANIPQSFNFASVGRILNFNDDEIRFLGYTFIGPTAPDALDYYSVHLVRTHHNRDRNIFEIALTPRSRTTPLFRGTIHIADESYALMGVDVEPNEVFQLPFVKEKHLRYKQQFAVYQDEIWLPIDIRIIADASVGIIGMSFPRIGFEQTSVITEYRVNPQLPDSLFRRARLVVDSSATRIDTSFWASNKVLPLTPEELHAYGSLDSTQSLDVQFRPGGITMSIGADAGATGTILQYADISFNRVEGFHLGARGEIRVSQRVDVRAGIAYAFSSKSTSYLLGGTLFTSPAHTVGVGVEGYRKPTIRPEAGYYGPLANTLTSLLAKNDYSDYYSVEGWRSFVTVAPSRMASGSFAFVNEMHGSLPVTTNYSLVYPSRLYRPNPSIPEGNLRSLLLTLRYGEPPVPLGVITRNALDVTIEYSSPGFAGSAFEFTRYEAIATLTLPTFGRSALFNPGFTFRIAGGASSGTLPLQRAFTLESGSSGIGPFGVMRAMEVKEFGGTEYVACNMEHNFRSLPFLALGIPFLYERSIELILHSGVARTWTRLPLPVAETGEWYAEAGFGVNRLFDILRADFTWRLTGPTAFRFTLGMAQIL
jgi:hypothetical protein